MQIKLTNEEINYIKDIRDVKIERYLLIYTWLRKARPKDYKDDNYIHNHALYLAGFDPFNRKKGGFYPLETYDYRYVINLNDSHYDVIIDAKDYKELMSKWKNI